MASGGLDPIGRHEINWLTTGLLLACSLALGVSAVWHVRRHPHPLISHSSLRVPTFAVTIWGGSLFRIAIGATPFLLPLMFQTGFGMNALTIVLNTVRIDRIARASLVRYPSLRLLPQVLDQSLVSEEGWQL